MKIELPENIRRIIEGKNFTSDSTGMSGSRVLIFDDMALKSEPRSEDAAQTARVTEWLRGKLPVPGMIAYEEDEKYSHTLMTRIKGRMACSACYLERPELLYRMLADALRMLWSVDISGCPREETPDRLLGEAERRVREGLVDMDNAEPDTFGENGFASPEELLGWLRKNKPGAYAPVLSHGDFCLPNILFDGDRVAGFIDLGRTGTGDKWRDIALCARSLSHNFTGRYGGRVYGEYDEAAFFNALGMEPDYDRMRFYTLLDELF